MSNCRTNGESPGIDDVRVKPGVRIYRQRADTEPSMTDLETEVGSRRAVKGRASKNRKTRSLYGVSPNCNFGPKGILESCETTVTFQHFTQDNMFTTIQDPASQKLKWQNPPLSVLVVKKMFDDSVILPFTDLVSWLIEEKKMIVFIEHKVLSESLLQNDAHFNCLTQKLRTFDEGDDLTGKIDFIICLGGDGTLLHASSLFQQSVPPVMAFHLGSLGFLTPFEFVNFRDQVTQVLEGNAALTLRSRLKCVVTKAREGVQSVRRLKNDPAYSCAEILVLNEVVIDRGPCPYLSNLDLYIEGRLVTSVQGDGLIVSTPTGSTAYAVAAGASMMHPNVPAIMITPICPHSLSFRPIVVPAGVEIKLLVSPEARNSAWVSFDGRNRQEILQGDSVRITTARYPVPSVCKTDQIDDWFSSLAECLHWNVRKTQQPLSSRNSTGTIDSDSESNHSNR